MNDGAADDLDPFDGPTDDPTDAEYRGWQADSVPWRKPYPHAYADAAKALLDRCTPTEIGSDAAEFTVVFLTRHLDPLFKAVMYHPRTDVAEGVRYLPGVFIADDKIDHRYTHAQYYFHWDHRSLAEEGTDRDVLYIDKYGLLGAVRNYLRQPQMHTDFLDWYCAETLCYREWLATVNHFGGLQMLNNPPLIIRVFGGGKHRSKMASLLREMRDVYDLLETGVFSWEVLWMELNRTRSLGAVWPGELYRLVDLRRRAL